MNMTNSALILRNYFNTLTFSACGASKEDSNMPVRVKHAVFPLLSAGLLVFTLSGCDSTGSYRVASVGSQGFTGADGPQGGQGTAGNDGSGGSAGANGTAGAGGGTAVASGGLVGAGGVAGTGLLANT